jgi:hypothetical protein
MFVSDFVLNGRGHGGVGEMLSGVRFEPGLLRPALDERGRRVCVVNTGKQLWDAKERQYKPEVKQYRVEDLERRGIRSPVFNATSLPKQAWVQLDTAVVRATRGRLRAWADLAASSTRGGFNAMAKTTLEYQAMTDPGEAIVDMDGLALSRTDRPLFNLKSVPLPITHSDFWFSQREIAISRNTGSPARYDDGRSCRPTRCGDGRENAHRR